MKLNKSFHIYGFVHRTMRIRGVLLCLLFPAFLTAQAQGEADPDFIRSIGKIYVVAGVCLVILLTLLVYLVLLDRKITRIEKQHHNE